MENFGPCKRLQYTGHATNLSYVFVIFCSCKIPCSHWGIRAQHACNAESCALLCTQGGEVAVNSVHIFPKNPEQLVVCSKTASVYIMTLQGQVIEHHTNLGTHSS
jgi:hypothetical protein